MVDLLGRRSSSRNSFLKHGLPLIRPRSESQVDHSSAHFFSNRKRLAANTLQRFTWPRQRPESVQ